MKCKYSRESRSDLWWERKSDVYTTARRVCVAETIRPVLLLLLLLHF